MFWSSAKIGYQLTNKEDRKQKLERPEIKARKNEDDLKDNSEKGYEGPRLTN